MGKDDYYGILIEKKLFEEKNPKKWALFKNSFSVL